jgi:hypothetical protein
MEMNPSESRVLAGLFGFYFRGASVWMRRAAEGNEDHAGLLKAMAITRRRHAIKGDNARAYLSRAIRQHHASGCLSAFNDRGCSGIEELKDTIFLALHLCKEYELSRLPYAPRNPAPYAWGVSWAEHRAALRQFERPPVLSAIDMLKRLQGGARH